MRDCDDESTPEVYSNGPAPEKSSIKKAAVLSNVVKSHFDDDEYDENDPLADSVERLSILGGELTSPVKKRRSVTFDKRYLPAEVEIDGIKGATMYHNGWVGKMKRAKQKPGQKGYQILMPEDEEREHKVNMEQPFKIVLEQHDGGLYTFTGSENSKEHKDGTSANEIVSLSPVKREQMMRLRMDMLLDSNQRHLVAFVLSAGKSPSSTALMRLQGMHDESFDQHKHGVKITFASVVYFLMLMLVGVCVKPPMDNLYSKWKLSKNTELVETCMELVKKSELVKKEFGTPVFGELSLFDYHVDLLTAQRASWMLTFGSNHTQRLSSKKRSTRDWELVGTLTDAGDDEISVTFDSDFLFGEMYAEAYAIVDPSNANSVSWHVSSINIDLYRTSKDYTDTMREWALEWAMSSIGAPSYLSIQVDEPQHLRITLEIGHDSDKDGDTDHGANNIIQEKSQLIQGRRVVGYIRPDDDDHVKNAAAPGTA
eukprot:TRINITY_DN14767_c0_g1_i1.p1 TRINITY_DN14767_c0_g1~~TRINITY_DN14767_c0_g1_i1.p1  ORF type:complete len:502 (+),score=78.95 TRINITY_DN14767_c0_g1_i1:60-1508(+)